MDPRFITKKMHAFLDYPVALSLMVLPFVLGLGTSSPSALSLSVVAGVAALILTLLTDHELGAFRILPYRVHLTVDLLVGVVFVAAPLALGFEGLDTWYYWLNGGAVLAVVGLHRPDPVPRAPVADDAAAA